MSRFKHTLLVSLEWRLIAFFITNIFLWVTTGSFWTATGLAFALQLILFVSYTVWHFFRCELHWGVKLDHPEHETIHS